MVLLKLIGEADCSPMGWKESRNTDKSCVGQSPIKRLVTKFEVLFGPVEVLRWVLSRRRLAEEFRNVADFLVRRQEGDDNLPGAAALAAQSVYHFFQWIAVAEALTQFFQRDSRGVLALTAVRAVIVRIIDVR